MIKRPDDLLISLVVAAAENGAIGYENQLLWHLPADLKFFKNLTWAMPVIMGRKTYESIGKPLPGRLNIVLTKQENWHQPNVWTVHSMEEALRKAHETDCKEVFVAGGAEIYRQMMADADRVYLTRVHTTPEKADAFFELEGNWQEVSRHEQPADAKNVWACTFLQYEKR